MNFNEDLENCLELLRSGALAGIPTRAGWMAAADATNFNAVEKLLAAGSKEGAQNKGAAKPVVMLAGERDFLRYVSAFDLAITDWLSSFAFPVVLRLEGVLDLAQNLPDEEGSALFHLVTDEFNKHLITRLRKPLAVLPLESPGVSEDVKFVAGPHTAIQAGGFILQNFV